MTETPSALIAAREQFLALVAGVRPDLHRYCARLTGSIFDGEDIVQETLARAFYALSQTPEVPALRPWLFRIAHNAAMDLLKSHEHKRTVPTEELEDLAGYEDRAEPAVVRAALAQFLALSLGQRSAVILKDVLGQSLEETADTMGTTVQAVKAALGRGRANLLRMAREENEQIVAASTRTVLDRYTRLFNARDWDGVRALISDDCRLDLVSKSQRRGKQVGIYFTNYEKQNVTLRLVRLEGRLALGAYVDGAAHIAYFIVLEVAHDRVTSIRDFRYVPYIAAEAEVELASEPPDA